MGIMGNWRHLRETGGYTIAARFPWLSNLGLFHQF